MKKTIIILVSISFLFVGCIDYSSTVKLNSDGSGTIEEAVLVSGAFLQMMNSFAQSFGDSSETENSFDIFDEDELKQQALDIGKGVKYVSGEKIKVDNREGYKAIYSFEDVSKLKLSENPEEKMPGDEMMDDGEAESGFITFNFKKGNPATLEVFFPEEKVEEESEVETGDEYEGGTSDEMMDEQMKMIMKDFRFSMNLKVNGDIVETNATNVDGNVVTFFKMDFGELLNMPDKFKELQKKEPKSMGEAKEMLKDIPGFKVEMNDKIFVKFD